jgi:predicted DNA-binding transcriptional regulator AlpA
VKIVDQTFPRKVKIGDAGGEVHFEDCTFEDGV